MLQEELSKTIKMMKKLDTVEHAAIDAEKKKKDDSDYCGIVADFYNSIKKVSIATNKLDYTISGENIQLLEECAEQLDSVIEAGVVDSETLNKSRFMIKKVEPNLSKEWKSFYQKKTTGSISKLNSLGKLAHDSEWVNNSRQLISNASEWNGLLLEDDGNNSRLDLFIREIDEIDKLEQNLNISDEIKEFLVLVTTRKAKICDINEDVIDWIKNERLEDKFVICFNS